MRWNVFIFLFIILINIIYSVVPIWNFNNIAVDLLYSETQHEFTTNGENCYIQKIINKNNDNSISYKKYLNYNGNNKGEVNYESVSYYYENQNALGVSNLVCPRGKSHPYDLDGSINKTNNFEERSDWDLKCFNHKKGYFLIFYLSNKDINFFYSESGGSIKIDSGYFGSEIYDFILEDGSEAHDYQYRSSLIYSLDNYIILKSAGFIMNSGQNKVNKKDYSQLNLILVKKYSQAYFAHIKII